MASSRPAKQGVRENAGSSALLDASWLLGLAIWRAQLESLCAATFLDLLLYGAAGGDRGCDLGGLAGRDDSGPMVALVTTAYGLGRGVARLPDTDPGCRFEPQFVGRADVKRAIVLVEVSHDLVATELAGCMRVDGEQPDGFLIPDLLTPGAGPRHEKALAARQTVDYRRLLAVQPHLIGLPRDAHASEVPDVSPIVSAPFTCWSGTCFGARRLY